jgi:hypothetical protein
MEHQIMENDNRARMLEPRQQPLMVRVVTNMHQSGQIGIRGLGGIGHVHTSRGQLRRKLKQLRWQHHLDPPPPVEVRHKLDGVIAHPRADGGQR